MFAYIVRRILYMPFILLGVIFITFVLFQMTTSPEALAGLHIGEKASQRQVYDWLANKGLISWTDAGEEKLRKIGDGELDAKHVTFFPASRIKELPGELESAEAAVQRATEDVDDLTEEYGKDSEDQDLLDARADRADAENDLTRLKTESDRLIDAAREQAAIIEVGLATWRAASALRDAKDNLKAREELLKEAQDGDEDTEEPEAAVVEAREALREAEKEHAAALKRVEAAEKQAESEIESVADITPDFVYTHFFAKFTIYLLEVATLDFGDTRNQRPVMEVIYQGMWPSLALTLPAFLLSELIGVFFGLFAAMYRQTRIDHTIVISAILLMSINGIALIMFGQKFLAADLNYFPITGYAEGLGAARFLMLPIFLYVVIVFGERVRFDRIVMLDETNQDYVRTARAKGVGENGVLFKHVFRNSLIPLITRWTVAIPSLYLGSLVLEYFFSIPGLGYLTVDAIQNSDANVIRAIVVFGAISFMIANLLSDVLYAVADPRVKLS